MHLILTSKNIDPAIMEQAVAAHIVELESYQKHCAAVARGEADPYPPPATHPEVEAAISRTGPEGNQKFAPDYKFVDFIPVEPEDAEALESRKHVLMAEVHAMENAAINDLLPIRKWRLHSMEYEDIVKKKMAKEKLSRAEEEKHSEHTARLAALREIQLHHAALESQIEDLTFSNINDWKLTEFKS